MVEADEFPDVTKIEDLEPQEDRIRTTLDDEGRRDRAEKILERAKNWQPSDKKDDVRAAHASGYGGFELYDSAKISRIRGALGILIRVSNLVVFVS